MLLWHGTVYQSFPHVDSLLLGGELGLGLPGLGVGSLYLCLGCWVGGLAGVSSAHPPSPYSGPALWEGWLQKRRNAPFGGFRLGLVFPSPSVYFYLAGVPPPSPWGGGGQPVCVCSFIFSAHLRLHITLAGIFYILRCICLLYRVFLMKFY